MVNLSGVNLIEFPQALADQLGIPLFAGQILASLIFLMMPLLPTILFTRGRNLASIVIVGIGSLSFTVALGWMPIWVFAMICLTLALMYGKNILGVFGRD